MTVGTRIDGTDYLFEVSHGHTLDTTFVNERFITLTGALMRMQQLRDAREGGVMRVIGHDDLVTVTMLFGEPHYGLISVSYDTKDTKGSGDS